MSENKELKKFVDISETNIKKLGVQALSDRPNVAGKYGTSGLSSAELKAWFDKLAGFIANKINTMHSTFASDEIAQYIKIALDEYDIEHLQDLIDSFRDGSFAEKLLYVYPTDTIEEAVSLRQAFRVVNQKIADEIEIVNKTYAELKDLIKNNNYGFGEVEVRFAEDGNKVRVDVDTVDEGDTRYLIFTFYNFGKWDALSLPLVAGEEDYTVIQQAPSLRKNKVLSQSSVALGENCVSGCMGYYISEIYYGDSSNNPQIRVATSMPVLSGLKISSSKLTASSSFTAPNYANGDKFNITCGSHYFYIGTIASINRDVITFTGDVQILKDGFTSSANANAGILTSSSFHVLIPGTDDYTMCVPAKPTVGIASVSALTVTEGGDNIAAGIMSSSRGRENISGGAYSDTRGRENIAGYCADASGRGTKALGKYSSTRGKDTEASGENSCADGQETKATALNARTSGYLSTATAREAEASGFNCHAKGKYSHAQNLLTEASGDYTTAMGRKCKATTYGATVTGEESVAGGQNSFVAGYYLRSKELAQAVFGKYNADNPQALLMVGNGTSDTARSNAFEVLKDGKLAVGTSAYSATDLTAGSSSLPTGALFFVYE